MAAVLASNPSKTIFFQNDPHRPSPTFQEALQHTDNIVISGDCEGYELENYHAYYVPSRKGLTDSEIIYREYALIYAPFFYPKK